MFNSCVASPDVCSLAKSNPNATATDLEQSFFDLVNTLDQRPIAVGDLTVDSSVLYLLAANSLYATTSWENTTLMFDMLMTGEIDEIAFLEFVGRVIPIDNTTLLTIGSVYPPLEGIHCSDRTPAARAGTYDKFLPAAYELSNTSKIIGRSDISLSMACAQWKLDAKERYEGDFQVSPKNPVLLIANTYDGHTPIQSAYNVSAGFEGSVVLEVKGYGVCFPILLLHPCPKIAICANLPILAYFPGTSLIMHFADHRRLLGKWHFARARNRVSG
jgi:hypothetical protein